VTRGANLLLTLGVFGPPAAWLATQQGQGALVYFACRAAGPPLGPLIGAAGAILCFAGGWLAWRSQDAEATASQRLIAQVALGAATLFTLANVATAAAAWLIPPCAR
jgi:hypothetical protein